MGNDEGKRTRAMKRAREKVMAWEKLKGILGKARKEGKRIVFTNGCFDILHAGHVHLLEEAKRLGDLVVVALNTDDSVRRLKGKGRPVNAANDRAEVIAGLASVDYVTFFGEETPCKIIDELRPDIHVKGGDYDPDDYANMPESKTVRDYGGEVRIIPLTEGRSTTDIIRKVKR